MIGAPAHRGQEPRSLTPRKRIGVRACRVALIVLVPVTFACATTKVTSGWDRNVDFSKYYTWSWRPDGSISDPVWAKRVQDVLTDELAMKKLAPRNGHGTRLPEM